MNYSNLRASDGDRDKVAEVLHAAYADGRISYEEHEERTAAVLVAKTFDELTPITSDLVDLSAAEIVTYQPPAAIVATEGANPEPDHMTAVLSDVKRVGSWRLRRRSTANTFLGTVHLDLTEATFDATEVELNGTQFLGTLFIRVPLGVTIRDETTNVMGSTSIKGLGDPDPTFPTIVIKGTNIMGDIKVRGPKKPSPWNKL